MIIRYFVADDVRQEVGGKVGLSGLYADNTIVVNSHNQDEEDDTKTESNPYAIDRLSFLININQAAGRAEFKAQFFDPSGNAHGELALLGEAEVKEGQSFNVIIQVIPFTFTMAGTYNIKFYVNKNVETLPFEIRIA